LTASALILEIANGNTDNLSKLRINPRPFRIELFMGFVFGMQKPRFRFKERFKIFLQVAILIGLGNGLDVEKQDFVKSGFFTHIQVFVI
jgi:hypothetical protein